MKEFLRSKVIMTIAAFLMIAAAVVIPLSGNIIGTHAQAPTSTPFSSTFNQASCSDPSAIVTVISSLHKGDVVSGTAKLTSNDGTEDTQGEDLVLTETNGPFSLTVTIDNSPQSISFSAAANNDSLTACIKDGIDGPDNDQTATISGIVTPVAPPSPSPTSEPHHPLADSKIVSNSTATGTVVSATTEASCSNPLTLVKKLHKGDVVNIQAEVAATNGEDAFREQSEGEFLKVYDLLGDSIQNIDYLASRVYAFTASDTDTLRACILPGVNGDGPDGDELGTISVQITPATPPPPTPIQDTRLAKIFLCVIDVAPIGSLVKIAGKGAKFVQFEGKVFKVVNYTYTGVSTFTATVQDIKTGQLFEVGWTILTAFPGGSCLDLIRDLTPIEPVS